jgi:hypothetical protein
MDKPNKRRRQDTLDAFVKRGDRVQQESEHHQKPLSDESLDKGPDSENVDSKVSTSVGVAPYDVSELSMNTIKLSDADKMQFLDKCWQPTTSDVLDTQRFGSNKSISFQHKWLGQRRWLAYSAHVDCRGGWCLPCLLFLHDQEKEMLGGFVNKPCINYNKSKEKFDIHEHTEYHKRCVERAGSIRAQMENIEKRIDTQIDTMAMENNKEN